MEIGTMKNLKSKKLYLQVYDEIKKYISVNHLEPGDKLPSEMKMCEMLGVSRNVLREAIKSLEITGVVHSTPGVGIVIQDFSTDLFISNLIYTVNSDSLLKQTEELRRVLELGFAVHAFHSMDDTAMLQIEDSVMRMENVSQKIKKSSDLKYGIKFAEADACFHKALFQNLDNQMLKSIIEFFWACDRYYEMRVTAEGLEYTVKKHRLIRDALANKDLQAFKDAMDHHFNVAYYKS